ncbi:MAG: hypothetical protein ACKO5E_17570 [bacterium]
MAEERRRAGREIPPRVKIDDQGRWTLVPPHCAFELEPDLADIEMLMKEGDFEAARDGALYLLEECQDMTAAHLLLGKIAEKDTNDLNVARAHYAYVFEITLKWLGRNELGVMNGGQKINRISLEAAEGLVRVLEKRGDRQKAAQVASYITAWKGHAEPSRRPLPEPSRRPLADNRGFRPPRPENRPASLENRPPRDDNRPPRPDRPDFRPTRPENRPARPEDRAPAGPNRSANPNRSASPNQNEAGSPPPRRAPQMRKPDRKKPDTP